MTHLLDNSYKIEKLGKTLVRVKRDKGKGSEILTVDQYIDKYLQEKEDN